MELTISADPRLPKVKSARLPKTWPHVILNGDVPVKIYKNKGHVRGKNFQTFRLSYYANGKRQLRRSMNYSEASRKAALIAQQKAEGALGSVALTAVHEDVRLPEGDHVENRSRVQGGRKPVPG